MPRITRITETKRGRFALFAGEDFLFSLDDETYALSGLREGSEVSREELEALRQKSDTRKALSKALELVSRRAYGETELYRRLAQRFDAPSAAAALRRAQELELVNDRRYAQGRAAFLLGQGKSRRAILADLAARGVDRSLAQTAVDALLAAAQERGEDPEQEALEALICRSYRSKLAAGKKEAVLAALYRRGFAPGAIRRAVEKALQDLEKEREGV